MVMTPRLVFRLVLALSAGWLVRFDTAYADYIVIDSVERLTSVADHIGIFKVEQIDGPHTVTNRGGGQTSGCYTVDFKLQGAFRGNPPQFFSRSFPSFDQQGLVPVDRLDVRSGKEYVFFFTDTALAPEGDFSTKDGVFNGSDWIGLDPPKWPGVAVDHRGCVLTNCLAILNLITNSLTLSRADEGVKIPLPTGFTDSRFGFYYFPSTLVIPTGLEADYRSATNRLRQTMLRADERPAPESRDQN
jgi:hypothetical protein